jgi:predicted GIY-YIG superfamily endonuclease
MKKVFYVYCLTFKNGKVYIGLSHYLLSNNKNNRYKQHQINAKKGMKLPIYNAWRKYGDPAFNILKTFDNRNDCANYETELIKKHQSTNIEYGYNVCLGGEGIDYDNHPYLRELMEKNNWSKIRGKPLPAKVLQASVDARKLDTRWKERISEIQSNPEYKRKASEKTRLQMKNGGSEYLRALFKNRGDVRSDLGKRLHKEKVKEFMNTERGKEIAKKGYLAMSSNPDNIKRSLEGMKAWRESEKNKDHCKMIAKLAAQKCSMKVKDPLTGVIYNSQKEMASIINKSSAYVSRMVKAGKFERVLI